MYARLMLALALLPLGFVAVPVDAQQHIPWERIAEFGGAIPKNEANWVTSEDYPTEALRRGEQGNVVVSFDISAIGRAMNCVVTGSSSNKLLDSVPCRLLERRARFKPATANDGTAIGTKGRKNFSFWIPER